MNSELSIVIPCKNEGEIVVKTINLLLDIGGGYPIIISDSSTNLDDIKTIEKVVSDNKKSINLIKGGIPSVARNNGAKLVKTKYILFLDADMWIFDKSLIDVCLSELKRKDLDLVTCRIKTDKNYNWVYKIFHYFQKTLAKSKPFAPGGFMMFDKEKFDSLGGFNEEHQVAEDYTLSSQIIPKKFKIINRYVYTSSRRFQKKGIFFMFKLMLKCWLNRNNKNFFKKSHNYWT